jgi:excisionase family DNA binding protein
MSPNRRQQLKSMLDHPDRYMSIEQASTYTTFSQQSLYRRIHENTIPHIKVGRRVLFDKLALDEWLAAAKRGPAETEP